MTNAALVTGGGSGMGQAAAWRLAAAGRPVAILDVDEAGMAATAARYPAVIQPHHVDVSDQGAVADAVRAVEADLGPIGRVMAAAGIVRVGLLAEQDTAQIMKMMAVNFGGVVNICQTVLPGMLARQHGDMVIFASIAGWSPQTKLGGYVASKFAVVGYTETLWMENRGRGVRFLGVCPPAVQTPMLTEFIPNEANRRKALAVTPDEVIDEIDRCLDRGQLWALPSASKVVWRARRHTPRLLRRVMGAQRFDILGMS